MGAVDEGEEVRVGVSVLSSVDSGVGSDVDSEVGKTGSTTAGLGEGDKISEGEGVGVSLGVGIGVGVSLGVGAGVGVNVGESDATLSPNIAADINLWMNDSGVGEAVGVGVEIGVEDGVGIGGVGVAVGVEVGVGATMGSGVTCPSKLSEGDAGRGSPVVRMGGSGPSGNWSETDACSSAGGNAWFSRESEEVAGLLGMTIIKLSAGRSKISSSNSDCSKIGVGVGAGASAQENFKVAFLKILPLCLSSVLNPPQKISLVSRA